MHRIGDILRRVVDHGVGDPRGEAFRHRLHGLQHLGRRLQGIGAGALIDQDGHRLLAVEIGIEAVILRAQLDPADIPHMGHPPAGVVLDHDIAELGGIDQPAQGLHADVEGGCRRHRRLAEHAGSDLHIVAAQRIHDVLGGQAARRGLVRIEPDAHGIVARALDLGVADAIDAGDRIGDLQGHVVRQIKLIPAAVGRDEMHHHHQVGGILLGADAQGVDLVGQMRLRDGDTVLHQHLGLVDVGAELEGDGQLEIAVARRFGLHVEHVVDAVDLLLERCRHRVGDGFGRGTGIAGGDDDGGGRDLGILRHRQAEIGKTADQGDQDRDDAGENRSLDEEMRELHGSALTLGREWR